ncbi:carbohydrate binding domain protein [Clostridium argentinense CDC 2741]|uniref:chitinase n=1 Tax=Clostridium argentinense CDC 2741 TaxID=1418104 RepID=A0A0C1TYV2_9CLOT|nr:glycosyl hydrolase family 18 protein [Clostridium argentinense]KIE44458.1 carbohydrate binding domain protein [Clostridium argentinense CDC 2741]
MKITKGKGKKGTVTKRVVSVTTAVSLSLGILVAGINPAEVKAVDLKNSKNVQNFLSPAAKRNVMYYGDWSIWGGEGNFYPKDIAADQITHLNFAFLDFDAEGNLVFTDIDAATGSPVGESNVQWGDANAGILPALQELRSKNPNLKIGVSLGGWSKSGDFSVVAASPQKRAKFVENVVKFIEYTNMDFVDVDWEYPGSVRQPDLVDNKNDEGTPNAKPQDKENYILLLQDLRNALNKQGDKLDKQYELSVALPAPKATLDLGIDIDALFNIVDFANIMTYDLRGAWDDTSGHLTGLYSNPNDPLAGKGLSVDESVNYLISQGAEPEKIVVGAAFYTRGWEKVSKGPDASTPGLYGEASIAGTDADQSPSRGAENETPLVSGDRGRRGGVWAHRSFNKLKAKYPGAKEYWDDIAKAPYLYDENSGAFFTYDNVRSITEKTNYVNENNLGGMISWMSSQDAPTNSSKRDELTKAAKKGLFGNDELPTYEIKYADLDITATVEPYKESWGSGGGYQITIKNNEVVNESGQALRAVERLAETIKLPKLYIKNNGGNLTSGDYQAGTVTNKDGYTIVDLKGVWEGKMINQGKSYSFKLKSTVAPQDISAIESIEITQRITPDGAEMVKQTIFGEATGPSDVNTKPVLKGVSNKTITIDDNFDPMDGITAYDKEDGDLTNKILVKGTVDTTKVGTYKLVYSVTDSKNETTTEECTITVKAKESSVVDFGVGQGIEWPAQVNAPFVDMVAWVTKPGYSNNGVANLERLSLDTGVKFFNLGFIQATSNTVKDGKVQWGWGGHSVLSEEHKDDTQYQGIKKSIQELRELGGDVAISLGGLNGTPFWEATQDVEVLTNTYMDIVQGYGLTRLDLDIEGSAQDKGKNTANAKAIKKVQDATGVDIVLTVPVLPSGLTWNQLDVLEAYLSEGVDVEVVNIMTMCYGSGTLLPGENYGTGSVRAIDSTKNQLKDYFKKFANIELTDRQAYGKIGTTSSIGFEGSAHPIFTKEWSKLVVDHAIEKEIAMTSFWSMNRDAMLETNAGVSSQYEFTEVFKKFEEGDEGTNPPINTAPILKGIEDKKIFIGETFDAMEGVTAIDKEDGNLTDKIIVTGNVDTNIAGAYTLIYTVEDSEGLITTKERIITVKEKPDITDDNFDLNKIYLEGDTVIYKGEKYTAKWWTKGGVPENNIAWEKEVIPNEDGSTDYIEGKIYIEGDVVSYQGKRYQAKWWTKSIPGSDDSWEALDKDENGSMDYVEGKAYVEGDIVLYQGKMYQAKWWTKSTPGSDNSWQLVN